MVVGFANIREAASRVEVFAFGGDVDASIVMCESLRFDVSGFLINEQCSVSAEVLSGIDAT
jgi:hypothetical protein